MGGTRGSTVQYYLVIKLVSARPGCCSFCGDTYVQYIQTVQYSDTVGLAFSSMLLHDEESPRSYSGADVGFLVLKSFFAKGPHIAP